MYHFHKKKFVSFCFSIQYVLGTKPSTEEAKLDESSNREVGEVARGSKL